MDLETFQARIFPVKNKLFRFASRLLGNSEDAKDVVQEVMIKVWNGRDQLTGIDNLEAWCMRITRNLSLDRLRQTQRRQTSPMGDTFDAAQTDPSPFEKTHLLDSMKKVSDLMKQLPDKQRQVMYLRDVEGYSYQEICDILEIDMSQVKVSLFRARNSVREQLTKINSYGL